jgi:hypothetical protein
VAIRGALDTRIKNFTFVQIGPVNYCGFNLWIGETDMTLSIDYSDKTVVVIGGTSGINLGIAEGFAGQICQRRTGVPLSCNAYFPKSKVRLEGEHKIFTRDCPEGRKLHNHFCPTCGSTVGWTLDLRPNQFGIAVGCFNDRKFPRPVASIWEEEMYAWSTLPAGVQHFPRARPVPSAG